MRSVLTLIILFFCLADGYSQTLNWQVYKILQDGDIEDIWYHKDTIRVCYITRQVDSATFKGRRLQRTHVQRRMDTFSHDTVSSVITDSIFLTAAFDGIQKVYPKLDDNSFIDSSISLSSGTRTTNSVAVLSTPYDSIIRITPTTRATRRVIYESHYQKRYPKKRFFMGVGFVPLLTYRIINVSDPGFSSVDQLDLRNQAEYVRAGYRITIPIGFSTGLFSRWYLELSKSSQGLRASKHSIDWASGLPVTESKDYKYRFNTSGVGIGYNWSQYHRTVNAVFDAGLSVQFLGRYKENDLTVNDHFSSSPETVALRKTMITGKAGFGINIRLQNSSSLRVIPSIFYNFRALQKSELATRLVDFGLGIAYSYEYKRHIRWKK